MNRNSTEATRAEDVAELKEDMKKSGHSEKSLDLIEKEAVERIMNPQEKIVEDEGETLVFVVDYFQEINELKGLINDLRDDINHLIGNTRIIVAARKRPSIGNAVLKNKKLGVADEEEGEDQRCNVHNCDTCDLMCDTDETFVINGKELKVPPKFSCKSKNVIYVAQCKICSEHCEVMEEDTYIGQTTQTLRNRINGHRVGFNNEGAHEKSALSTHS